MKKFKIFYGGQNMLLVRNCDCYYLLPSYFNTYLTKTAKSFVLCNKETQISRELFFKLKKYKA